MKYLVKFTISRRPSFLTKMNQEFNGKTCEKNLLSDSYVDTQDQR